MLIDYIPIIFKKLDTEKILLTIPRHINSKLRNNINQHRKLKLSRSGKGCEKSE